MSIAVILFDLDNTLYPASSGVMQMVDTRITAFVQSRLGVGWEQAALLRQRYFSAYGTTLCGLQRHHQVDTEDYLCYVHDLALESLLARDSSLDELLEQVTATKVIFTNAPGEHAARVLSRLGVERHFTQVFDIRFMAFQPKPDPQSYKRALAALDIAATDALLIEDTPQNLAPARAMGMTTMLVGPCAGNGNSAAADYHAPDILAALQIALAL